MNLVNKYYKELQNVNKSMWEQYAEALDLTIKHINTYDELDDNLKISCAYVVKKVLLDNKKFEILDITTLINKFIKYYEDLCFYDEFIKKHQQ